MNFALKFVSDKFFFKMGAEKDEDIRIANEDYLNLRKIAGSARKDMLTKSGKLKGIDV